MPRRAQGARLWLQPERRDPATGVVTEPAVWCIRDGRHKRSTGVRGSDARSADDPRLQAALRAWLAERHDPRPGPRHPAQIPVADVLSLYAREVASQRARPKETARRLGVLLAWWGDKTLADITGAACRAYAADRPLQAARRELEDLRAAIGHHRREGLCAEIVAVALPDKATPRERWLTRSEAAKLIWTAWRYRERQKGVETDRRSRRHVARFILIALYTGSRAGVICAAATRPGEGRGFVDYERGVFYRRAPGARQTKKRAPPIRIPDRLLAHMRRWRRLGLSRDAVIEWNGAPIGSVKKALARTVAAAELEGVSAHTFRHTAATWGMQNGGDPWQLAGMLAMSLELLLARYGHHHPDHQADAAAAITGRKRGPGQTRELVSPLSKVS
jgi:integrase